MVQVGGADGMVFERGPAILGSIILGIGSVLVYLGTMRVAVDQDRQVSDWRSYWMLASGIILWGVVLVMVFSLAETTSRPNLQLPDSEVISWSAGNCVAFEGEWVEPTKCDSLADGYIVAVVANEQQCPNTAEWVVDVELGMVACIAER